MKDMKMLVAGTAVVAAVALGLAGAAAAQGAKPAGVVTTLQGTANLQRISATDNTPQVQPLKFRDELRLQDRITTGDQSLARILMGGKAVVTVREHSSLTITEQLGNTTIDITAGKIALTVAKERMGPNDRIDIKTPNAVAGVRGTVVITEVSQATASAAEQSGGVNTRFTLLTGLLEVFMLDPSTGRPGTTRFTLNPLQQLSVTGFTPPQPPRNITSAQGQAAAGDFKVNFKEAPAGSNAGISDKQVEQASNAAAATGNTGSNTGNGTGIINKTNNDKPGGDPKEHLPPNCTNNCGTPPTVNNGKSGIPPECLGNCPAEGRAPLGRRTTTRR
jgi:hypothetical protein